MNYASLHSYIGKSIAIFMNSGGSMSGKIVSVDNKVLILSSRFSNKHVFDMDYIESFWCDDDKPEEDMK